MKLSTLFVLRTIADEHLLIPTGSAASHVHGLISLNESGALLYRKLQSECTETELMQVLLSEYDVTAEQAREDVSEFLMQMRDLGILLEA